MMTTKACLGLLLTMLAGCSARLNTTDAQDLAAVGGVPAVAPVVPIGPGAGVVAPAACPAMVPSFGPAACDIDTRQVVEIGPGRFIEIITANGQLFEFEDGLPVRPGVGLPQIGSPPGVTGVDLSSVPLYAAGPCLGAPPGACRFDTQAFVRLPEGRLLEYVTRGGQQWVFESAQMTGAGVDLNAIPRYAPICALRALTGGLCIFDTRTFIKVGAAVVESITAYGRKWEIDLDGRPLPTSGVELASLPQYACGPCLGGPLGQCVLGTRTFEPLGPELVETITVNGVVFRFSPNGAELPGSRSAIGSFEHWATGICL